MKSHGQGFRIRDSCVAGGVRTAFSWFREGAFHLDSAWQHDLETVAALIATTKATTR
ncbi:hypothetical protein [Wenjunlia tyrosinilytica]|uniref:hypothetical protein n=1 Tax=Wenjunlia tyrosinilytica TaxID=1544741 RepID=UPI001669F71E|nr:hypothetical protein [Wenjunlia tyrosinilytica]